LLLCLLVSFFRRVCQSLEMKVYVGVSSQIMFPHVVVFACIRKQVRDFDAKVGVDFNLLQIFRVFVFAFVDATETQIG
jgi:hypothetical protein